MGSSAFQSGAEVAIKGTAYTLLRRVTDTLWQIEETKSKRIKEISDAELRHAYATRELTFLTDQSPHRDGIAAAGKPFHDIPQHLFEEAKLRRAYVTAILDRPSSKPLITPVIQELWTRIRQPEKPPGSSSVLKWKAKYVAAGRDINSLVTRCDKKGNRESRYPKEVMEIVTDAIDEAYMKPERKTIQDALDVAIIRVERENQLRPGSLQLPRPTRRLITRLVGAIPEFDKYSARHGRTAAMRKFRSVQAHRTTNGPLERAEIDHTPLDLLVIDDNTRLPLGRPLFTACIDDYSRSILGMSISFEPASYLSVARCLRDAFLPKTKLNDRYPRVKHAWESHGVMRELVVDNGTEFHSDSLEAACFSLGIEIHYAARKTGWFKGKIERFLGSANRGIAHGNPGTTFSNIFEKDEYDPAKHAVIRMSVLLEMVHVWIADYYHQKPHRSLGVPPAVMWSTNIKPEDILLPDDPADLDAILGRIETRTLTHKGIELFGMQYNSRELAELRRQLGDRLDVEIRIDDANIGKIIVLSPDKKRRFDAQCLSYEYANGLSRWQHKVCKGFANRELGASNPMAWLEAKETIAQIIAEEFSYKRRKSAKTLGRYQGASSVQLVTIETAVPPRATAPVLSPVPAKTVALTSSDSPVAHSPVAQQRTPKRRFEPILRDRGVETFLDHLEQDAVHE